MRYLFINSATANLVVAILIDGKISYLYDNNDDKDTSSKIMPVIDEAFKKSSITPKEIDKIFVVNGPGSFTGIRVGLTVAKVMGYSFNIPVIPVSSLEFMCSGFDFNVIGLIDARRGYVFAGGYDRDLNSIYKDSYVLFDNIDSKFKYVSYDKFDFDVLKPKFDLSKIIKKHENDSILNVHSINPNYLKLTEAEEKRLNDKRS
ncbi:MAG: tRNA (adenosine(37)-N6)-threonylcarbamoyltransferase complex dimerization subunit type 1 TsaB [Bacilli bacterium]|nr:tRNA (adenosine(37)-N6)-threonylcarbamoyltransferase complex dimerization subunit type 1 TsaB [Bacilli bacterium]